MSSKLKSILAGDQGPIMDFEALDLAVDGVPAVDVLTTALKFDVITRVSIILRFADAAVLWSVFAAEVAALTNGFYMQYSGEGLDTLNVVKDNGDFFNIGWQVNIEEDTAATPNVILAARWNFKDEILPWGLKMWDSETFGFKVQDDMTTLASIDSLEAIVEGFRFAD